METIYVNLFGGPGTGKCFLRGTKILMYDGTIKNVEDIVIGDKVMGDDSIQRIVKNLSTGSTDMYKVTPVKGEPFIVTGNHMLPLKYNHHGIEIDEIHSVIDYMNLSEFKKNRLKLFRTGVDFKNQTTIIEPYFIGLWLGDGNNADQGITSMDKVIIEYLENYATLLHMKLTKTSKNNTKAIRCNISNIEMGKKSNFIKENLRELNLFFNKHIPNIYKINGRENRLELLAGLIDSDGHMSSNGFEITTKYNRLADDILFLCRSLGLAAYNKKCTKGYKKDDGTYFSSEYNRIFISGDCSIIPTKLKRKKAIKRKQIKNVLRTGFKIEKIGRRNFYGFEVDKNHLFLLGDFTVTHNSTTMAGLFSLLKLNNVNCEIAPEFAKEVCWEKRNKTIQNQIYIFGKQHHRLWRLKDEVDVVITDSPLYLSLYYGENTDEFRKMVLAETKLFNNLNIFLNRKKDYNPEGRYQTEEEAKEIDVVLKELLNKNSIDYYEIDGDCEGINTIANSIMVLLTDNDMAYSKFGFQKYI